MARRILSGGRLGAALTGLGLLALSGCRRGEQHAAPSASASAAASADAYAENARQAHLELELTRARTRWSDKPNLGECSAALHEKEDLELCQAAASALAALEQEPARPAELLLPALESSALALARLSKRTRFLSLSELAKKRMTADGGAPLPAASASARAPWPKLPHGKPELDHHGPFELSDGPISRLMSASVRLEHDAVRNLGAYLEYAELPVRRSAFATVKRLHEQHPQWPQLTQLLREATLLESDPSLKAQLGALSVSAVTTPTSDPQPNHSPGSK